MAYLRQPPGFVRCTVREPVTVKPTTQPPGISPAAVDISHDSSLRWLCFPSLLHNLSSDFIGRVDDFNGRLYCMHTNEVDVIFSELVSE